MSLPFSYRYFVSLKAYASIQPSFYISPLNYFLGVNAIQLAQKILKIKCAI